MGTFTTTLADINGQGEEIFIHDPAIQYPIFDETYRPKLEGKILDHYALYEIGQETVGQFRFALNRRLREIMPYYNQLYLTTQTAMDPFKTMDYTDAGTSDSTTTGTSHSSTDSASRAVASELPQVHLSGNEDYATNANDVIGNATTDGTSNSGVNGTVNRHVSGSQGHQATLMMQYRKSLLNIDMLVIADLSDLFMLLWDNGDEFHGRGYQYGFFGFFGTGTI